MDDRELTEALARLGLDRRNHRAVALLPLVEVAWADGRVQRAEKRLIGEIAQRYGLEPGDEWLERWLTKKPSATTFLAARTVLLSLMARSGRSDVKAPENLEHLLELCVGVAEAAGGLFGLAFTYEQSERDCIEEISRSLQLGPALPEQVARDWDETTQRLSGPGIGDQVTVVRRIPQRRARSAPATEPLSRPSAPPEPDLATARLTRPHPRKPTQSTPAKADFVEDDPTTPYFDDLHAPGSFVVDGDDEDT